MLGVPLAIRKVAPCGCQMCIGSHSPIPESRNQVVSERDRDRERDMHAGSCCVRAVVSDERRVVDAEGINNRFV